jgi:hypothetical protein
MPVPAGGDLVVEPDRLATVEDLMRMPGTPSDLDPDSAGLLLEVATAVVQAAAGGQRILQVVDDEVTLYAGYSSFLRLPQQPVTEVSSVTADGVLLTGGSGARGTWRRAPAGVWRDCGWVRSAQSEVPVTVIYTHGYAEGDQRLQLARSAVLSLARGVASNPTGATRLAIDDYQEAYDRAASTLEASTALAGALRRQYGRRAGSVRVS